MEYFSKHFAFLHWIMYLLEFFQIVTRTPMPESTATEAVAVSDEIPESTPVETQKMDVSQQTNDTFETQKQNAREDELMKEISDLQDQLDTAHRVNGESKQKVDRLTWYLDALQLRYNEQVGELRRKRSEEITKQEFKMMEFQDDYNNRIADLELINSSLMERIEELEMEQASRPPQRDPVCGTRSGELKDSVTKIESIQQYLSSLDVIAEHVKSTINHVLELVKGDIASAFSGNTQLDEEKEQLIKETASIKSEMESVKLELDDAKKTIAELEQRQSGLIAAESQMKTIADGKDALLASKDAELKQLRESCEQARRKSQAKTGVDIGCGTDDPAPLAEEPKADPEFKEVLSKKTMVKRKTEAAGGRKEERVAEKDRVPIKSESVYNTVMDALSSSQSTPPSGKTPSPPSGQRPAPPSAQKLAQPSGQRPAPPSGQRPAPPSGQRPVPHPATDVKPVVFASADIRYKQKPIEGYTANLPEDKTLVHPPARPGENATPTAAPTVVPEKAKDPTVATKPAPCFAIISKEIKPFESADTLVLLGIHQQNYGRVVGRGGENIRRLQEAHGVMLSFVQNKKNLELYDMNITGGSPIKRRAAAREIIECLPVTIECYNVDLRQLNHPNFRSTEDGVFVHIRRPRSPGEKLQLTGRIGECRKAFNVLVNGVLSPRPSPPK